MDFKGKVAIIGSRRPSEKQHAKAYEYAKLVSEEGYIVTTGGAYGIDHAAMLGCIPGSLEVYLPWASFNAHIIPDHATRIVYNPSQHKHWLQSVNDYHPNVAALSASDKKLHARNYGIVYGTSLVAAYPKSIHSMGGTGQGVRIAQALGIQVVLYDALGEKAVLSTQ